MFGMFREKTLDEKICVDNVVDAILDTWSDQSNLRLDKFNSIYHFRSRLEADKDTVNRFEIKRLQLITSVAHTLLSKESHPELLNQITAQTLILIKDLLHQNLSLKPEDLSREAERLATIRFSANPKEAGQLIE